MSIAPEGAIIGRGRLLIGAQVDIRHEIFIHFHEFERALVYGGNPKSSFKLGGLPIIRILRSRVEFLKYISLSPLFLATKKGFDEEVIAALRVRTRTR